MDINKKLNIILSGIIIVLLIYSINISSKWNYLQIAINNQSNSINNLSYRMNDINYKLDNMMQNITTTLEEQQKIVADKSYTTLSYQEELEIAKLQMSVTLKQLEKDTKVMLKVENGTSVTTIPMENRGGLVFWVDVDNEIDKAMKYSVVIDGSIMMEEHLFDIDLQGMMANRFRIWTSGTSTGYDYTNERINYSKDYELVNYYNNDISLKVNNYRVKLLANQEVVFDQSYNQQNNTLYEPNNQEQYLKIFIGDNTGSLYFDSKEDIELEFIITVTDDLGLTYEYKEKEYLNTRDYTGHDTKVSRNSNSSTQKTQQISSKIEEGYYQFHLVR